MSQQQSADCLEADSVSVLSPIISRIPGGHRFALVRPMQSSRTALSLKMSRCEFLTTLSDTREGKLGPLCPFCSFFASVVLFDDTLGLRFFAIVSDTQLQLTVYSQHSIPLVSSCQDWCVMGLDQRITFACTPVQTSFLL